MEEEEEEEEATDKREGRRNAMKSIFAIVDIGTREEERIGGGGGRKDRSRSMDARQISLSLQICKN